MRFADIPGHEDVKQRLISQADEGRMPHALLIEGPAGSGKFALARALAQYIHCTNRIEGVDSCGKCPSCQQHQTFNHADAIFSFPIIRRGSTSNPISDDYLPEFRDFLTESQWMDYEDWLQRLDNINAQPVIYVSEANELLRKLNYTAVTSRYKIVMMWLPEKLREDAANKLLKLVEEPHSDTIFIMVSNAPRQILPTIYSRTQRVGVKRYADSEVAAYIESSFGVAQPDAEQIAKLAEGNMARALSLISVSKERQLYLDLFKELMRKAYTRKVADLKAWAADVAALGREREMQFLDYCARMMRENFILNLRQPELNSLTADEMQFSVNFSPYINEGNVLKLFKVVNDAKTDIAANANAKLVNFDVALKTILLLKK